MGFCWAVLSITKGNELQNTARRQKKKKKKKITTDALN